MEKLESERLRLRGDGLVDRRDLSLRGDETLQDLELAFPEFEFFPNAVGLACPRVRAGVRLLRLPDALLEFQEFGSPGAPQVEMEYGPEPQEADQREQPALVA